MTCLRIVICCDFVRRDLGLEQLIDAITPPSASRTESAQLFIGLQFLDPTVD